MSYAFGVAAVAALISLSGPVFAASVGGVADPADTSNSSDGTFETGGPTAPTGIEFPGMTGFGVLGVDISSAGDTPEAVQQYVATLPMDQQTSVLSACDGVNNGTTVGVDANSRNFCWLLSGQM